MKRALILAPLLATGGCTTTDWDLLGDALYLYSAVSYLNEDCPFGASKYHDGSGYIKCAYKVDDRDGPRRGRHRHHGDAPAPETSE